MMSDNFAKVVMPQFSKAWADGDSEKIRQSYQEATRYNAYFILPVVVFGIVNAGRILEMVGKEYTSGTFILALLLFSQFFGGLLGPHGYLLSMTGYENYEIFNGFVKLVLALSLGVLLGPQYTWGIAFSIAGSDIFASILKTLQVRRFFGFWPHINARSFYF
jgi:O-antigen/teichoic acid export membrane protein